MAADPIIVLEDNNGKENHSNSRRPRRRFLNARMAAFVVLVFTIASFAASYSNLHSAWSTWYDPKSIVQETEIFSTPSLNKPTRGSNSLGVHESINRTAFSSSGLHVCSCLTPDHPSNNNLPNTPKRIRWLHFPKTGTSFISTLWSNSCSTRERYIDLSINSHQCSLFDKSSFSMYDFALMKRYPWELYGAPNLILQDGGAMKDIPLGLVAGTQHMPLSNSLDDFKVPSSHRLHLLKQKNQLRNFPSEFEENITVATIFRQPEQRIISAFYDSRHANGVSPDQFKELLKQTSGKTTKGAPSCKLQDGKAYDNPLECFARFPGIAGCMARMLTGEKCADGQFQQSGLENVPDAVDVIMNQLEFVGLTEEWNESICQFHRLFAGKLDSKSGKRQWIPPLQGEFANVHASKNKKLLGLEELHGFKDVADGVVYEAAKLKFDRMVGPDKCYKFMSWDELQEETRDKDADMMAEVLPFINTNNVGKLCQPKSCSDLGKQCGEWPDGCGNIVICGICNRGRTGVPSSWRTQCIEGKCVDYCPPWDKKGYWFLSDVAAKPDVPKIIKDFAKGISKQREQRYFSPTEAVRICVAACEMYALKGTTSLDMEVKKFIDDRMCICGNKPNSILASNVMPHEFSLAHDLDTDCHKTKARARFGLSNNDTQPICCSPYDHSTRRPPGWARMFFLMQPSLEGEYFAHSTIECGGYGECENFGRKNEAEMVVFDIFNSMCYAARNVFDLESKYAVTKDNQERYYMDLRKK